MRSLIISSALLVILVQCSYPVAEDTYPTTPSYQTPPPTYPTPQTYPTTPSYPVPKKYPTAPTYPTKPSYPSPPTDYAQKPSYSAPPPPAPSGYTSSDSEVVASEPSYSPAATTYSGSAVDYNSAGTFRQRAKARTAHNRQFQRRALMPIRRFQQKKQ
ncbi:hypothetical protein CRE_18644 [Caenorhabditis remanei]|uniref:Uncharacterized protein n=1 Tax=Caenorhabditis remanei TaxID=31234 RepID=E3LKK5_CAERE|nr:hypothetical protein CRE_18644 [Caenorhabditis remanei]